MQRPRVIAEIGQNHNGSMDTLLSIVTVCAAAKVDFVKFQTRIPDLDTPIETWNTLRRPPWQMDIEIPYIEYRRKMELTKENYYTINEHCSKLNVQWSTSCWGVEAFDFITSIGIDLPALKVPSAKLTNEKLIRKMAAWSKASDRELWVSLGMSTVEETDAAVAWLKDELGDRFLSNVVLFNCNSSYPAKTSELNLSLIHWLKERYDNCRVGYSSHSTTLGTSCAAMYLGYEMIEVHVTFDRNAPGSDHFASLGFPAIFKLMSGLKDLEDAYGDGLKRVYDSEIPFRKKLRGC